MPFWFLLYLLSFKARPTPVHYVPVPVIVQTAPIVPVPCQTCTPPPAQPCVLLPYPVITTPGKGVQVAPLPRPFACP